MMAVWSPCFKFVIENLSLCFNGHFTRWTWVSWYQNISILDFVGAKGGGGNGDNWSCRKCKAPVISSPPTNKPFYRPYAFLSPNQQCQSTFVVYEGVDPYYNWLTQSRLDTFADNTLSSLSDSATGAAQSSLLFTVGRGSSHTHHRVKQPPVGPDFGKDRLGARRTTDEVDAARKLFGFSFLTVTRCSWLWCFFFIWQ